MISVRVHHGPVTIKCAWSWKKRPLSGTGEYNDHSGKISRTILTVCAEMLWFSEPAVASAVRVASLRQSRLWRSVMLTHWAHSLRLWCLLDRPVLTNVLKWQWRHLMAVKLALIHHPACQLHAPSKLATAVSLCCVITRHTLEGDIIVSKPKNTCALIALFNQHLDMPHLCGQIILAKEECWLTWI